MMASTSRMCERNLLPRPSPEEAPLTRPAMSTKRTAAGTVFLGAKMAVRRARRSSGTRTMPTLGSIVVKG